MDLHEVLDKTYIWIARKKVAVKLIYEQTPITISMHHFHQLQHLPCKRTLPSSHVVLIT